MSVDFETRARRAGVAVRMSVAQADLSLSEPPVSATGFPMRWALAGATAAVAVVVTLSQIGGPNVVADDVDFIPLPPEPVTTTTPDEPPAPIAVTPTPTTEGLETTTTTAPETTTTADTEAPLITIESPIDGEVFEEKTIVFTGTTEPGARVFGGPYEATVDASGNWSITLVLSPGENRAVFTATDASGNTSSAVVTPVFQPPVTTTKPVEEPKQEAFTAHATWIECDSEPPFDEYYGTGVPGSWVEVISPYGTGETIVKPNGEWYVKVIFTEAPRGVVFDVKVKDQFGRSKVFDFVAVAPK